jgi:release factor-specific protein-(glutamine-N5) methyltransferase/tRNA threonylcarbamoyl adenosine modification protein (Sua5/YciO/YrdC/YwlC family)
MATTWTVLSVLRWTSDYLARHDDPQPRLSAQWLVSAVTGKTRVELYTDYDEPLSQAELDELHAAIERRAAGEPLQYVTGEMPFRHIVLRCEQGVLIPRPETEVLVDAALEGADAVPGPARVLELGCGTGCIALSIASERQGTHVVATDLAPAAVALATRNRDALGLTRAVDVVGCDLAAGVDARLMGTFDVLVSNPPYIPTPVMATLPREVVGHEPALALDGGQDGLDVFRRILALAPSALAPGGMLAVELFEESLDTAADLVRAQSGWATVEVRDDLTGRHRVLVAVREGELVAHPEPERAPGTVMTCDQAHPTIDVVAAATKVLLDEGVVVVPTDSVYGIAALATPGNPGHERIFSIKHRDRDQTLPLLLADATDLATYADDPTPAALALAQAFWPGALTLVVRASGQVPADYRRDDGTVALRVPDSTLVRAIIRDAGVPLACTSANTHGAPSPASAAELEPVMLTDADLTLDGGAAPEGVASTIVICMDGAPAIAREGAIPKERVEEVLNGR